MDIFGVPFQNVGETTINIQDVKPNAGIDVWGGDLLRMWNPLTTTYTFAFYFGETYDAGYEEEFGQGWADGDQVRLNFPISAGQGLWLSTISNAAVTIAGEVLPASENLISTQSGKMDISAQVEASAGKLGLGKIRTATYRAACMQGWAPVPTNDTQRAVWDEIRGKQQKLE